MNCYLKLAISGMTVSMLSLLFVACTPALAPLPAEELPIVETATLSATGNTLPATPTASEEEAVPPEPTPESVPADDALESTLRDALIRSIDVNVADASTDQVTVVVQGEFRNGCAQIDQISQRMEGSTFIIEITTIQPADMMCTQALVPFEETVQLEVSGLPTGTYTVDVNGVTETFVLE
ncbi:MAG: hypothetical protein R3A44_31335 [Caldilineaceae bacterium]